MSAQGSSALDGGIECRTCGYPVTDGSRGIQLVHREIGAQDVLPPIPTCTDCGNQVNSHGRCVARYEIIILEEREDEGETH
jgi:hypothetical protein